jgi:uncharacterized protein YchJ
MCFKFKNSFCPGDEAQSRHNSYPGPEKRLKFSGLNVYVTKTLQEKKKATSGFFAFFSSMGKRATFEKFLFFYLSLFQTTAEGGESR